MYIYTYVYIYIAIIIDYVCCDWYSLIRILCGTMKQLGGQLVQETHGRNSLVLAGH